MPRPHHLKRHPATLSLNCPSFQQPRHQPTPPRHRQPQPCRPTDARAGLTWLMMTLQRRRARRRERASSLYAPASSGRPHYHQPSRNSRGIPAPAPPCSSVHSAAGSCDVRPCSMPSPHHHYPSPHPPHSEHARLPSVFDPIRSTWAMPSTPCFGPAPLPRQCSQPPVPPQIPPPREGHPLSCGAAQPQIRRYHLYAAGAVLQQPPALFGCRLLERRVSSPKSRPRMGSRRETSPGSPLCCGGPQHPLWAAGTVQEYAPAASRRFVSLRATAAPARV